MVNPDLPPRKGAHRARSGALSTVLPSVVAVAAVLAVVVALYLTLGGSGGPAPSVAGATSTASTAAATSGAPVSASPPTSASGTSGPGSPSPSPTTSTPVSSPSASSGPSSPGAGVPVVVLNETTRVGLAGSVAGMLRGKGWTVIGVGNFRGTVADTTVYYPPGQQAAAAALAADLPVPQRLRPTFGNLDQTALTVVLTDNYP